MRGSDTGGECVYGPSPERLEELRSSLDSRGGGGTNSPSRSAVRKKRSPPKRTAAPRTGQQRRRPTTPADLVDPAWFFPVGKKVVHLNLGKGTVVDPPPFETVEDARVRVAFENGKTLDFPALGSEILPDTGNF